MAITKQFQAHTELKAEDLNELINQSNEFVQEEAERLQSDIIEITGGTYLDTHNIDLSSELTGFYWVSQGGYATKTENANSKYVERIDISAYRGYTLQLKSTFTASSSRCCLVSKDNGQVLKAFAETDIEGEGDTYVIPDNAAYLYLSHSSASVLTAMLSKEVAVEGKYAKKSEIPDIVREEVAPIEQEIVTLSQDVNSLSEDVASAFGKTTIVPLPTAQSGSYYNSTNGALVSGTAVYYEPVDLSDYVGKTLKIAIDFNGKASTLLSSQRAIILCSGSSSTSIGTVGRIISEADLAASAVNEKAEVEVTVNANTPYIAVSYRNSDTTISITYSEKGALDTLSEDVEECSAKTMALEEDIQDIVGSENITPITLPSANTGGFYDGSTFYTGTGVYYEPLDISSYMGKKLRLTITYADASSLLGSTRAILICSGNSSQNLGSVTQRFIEKDLAAEAVSNVVVKEIIVDANYIAISYRNSTTEIKLEDISTTPGIIDEKISEAINGGGTSVLYVATNGSDENTGLSSFEPLATVNKALELGADCVSIASGIYKQQIDLSKAKKSSLCLLGADNMQRTIFTTDTRIVASSATVHSGKVKKVTVANPNVRWLFQENVNDVNTVITATEHHPCQRGLFYRCEDTKIVACASSTLADALTEIEASDSYLYFYDTVGGVLYFSSPETISSSKPLVKGTSLGLFSETNKFVHLLCNRIEANCMHITFDGMNNPIAIDCKVRNAYNSGGFVYNYCNGATFIRCEVSRTYASGEVGDGFNGHNTLNKTNSPLTKGTTVLMEDCWSHDCYDDGYSDHECSETVIRGGLFEYNGKAGVTPSYGSHCSCYNVYSRHNQNGFMYIATPDDAGNGGQLYCVGCVAEENDNPVGQSTVHCGYVIISSGNTGILLNCKSIGNRYGYNVASGSYLTLIDCGSYNDQTVKTGGGTFTIKNTTLVS